MSNLIDRDIAIATIKTECLYSSIDKDEVIDLLNDLPTARLERKTGKWIKHRYAEEAHGMLIDNYECSICHTRERKRSNFCPECGSYNGGGHNG